MYAVYDLKDHEQCIGIFDRAQDVADYFGMERASVFTARAKGCLIKHRYSVEKIKEDVPEEEPTPYCFNELVEKFYPKPVEFEEFDEFKAEIKRRMNEVIIDEEWKKIDDFDYSVSNYGRIINNKTKKIKTPENTCYGYQIYLWNKQKRRRVTITRLVAENFIRHVKEDERVIHIDKDINNNYFKNLKIIKK